MTMFAAPAAPAGVMQVSCVGPGRMRLVTGLPPTVTVTPGK